MSGSNFVFVTMTNPSDPLDKETKTHIRRQAMTKAGTERRNRNEHNKNVLVRANTMSPPASNASSLNSRRQSVASPTQPEQARIRPAPVRSRHTYDSSTRGTLTPPQSTFGEDDSDPDVYNAAQHPPLDPALDPTAPRSFYPLHSYQNLPLVPNSNENQPLTYSAYTQRSVPRSTDKVVRYASELHAAAEHS